MQTADNIRIGTVQDRVGAPQSGTGASSGSVARGSAFPYSYPGIDSENPVPLVQQGFSELAAAFTPGHGYYSEDGETTLHEGSIETFHSNHTSESEAERSFFSLQREVVELEEEIFRFSPPEDSIQQAPVLRHRVPDGEDTSGRWPIADPPRFRDLLDDLQIRSTNTFVSRRHRRRPSPIGSLGPSDEGNPDRVVPQQRLVGEHFVLVVGRY